VANKNYYCLIVTSGSAPTIGNLMQSTVDLLLSVPCSDIRYLAASETVQLNAYHNDGTGNPDIYGNIAYTWLSGYLLGT